MLVLHQSGDILVHLSCLLIVNVVNGKLLNYQDSAGDFARLMLAEVHSPERALVAEFADLEYLVEVLVNVCQAARIL